MSAVASSNPERLKALSIRQPWAELILRGHKGIDYRTRPTKIRGRIYIYASLAKPEADEPGLEEELGCPLVDLPRGVVIGTVELVDCVEADGEYEWHLGTPQRLGTPLAPAEQPQPVWFHPFGRPDDAVSSAIEEENGPPRDDEPGTSVAADEPDGKPTATRFAPVIASANHPPFTEYH
ncbi:MAG: ASCH domain-containing protein, partial [Pirellulales bacterium]